MFPHGSEDSHLLKHLQLSLFSHTDVTMTPGLDQKVQKFFAGYLYSHLNLSPLDMLVGQNFLNYPKLLHAQGVTLENAGKSGLIRNEQSLKWSLLMKGEQGS